MRINQCFLRERIEDNLTELSGDSKKAIVEYNAKIEINKALDLLDELLIKHQGVMYGVESAFS